VRLNGLQKPDWKTNYVDLFKEFIDVFAWTYEDLKPMIPTLFNIEFHLRWHLSHSDKN